MMKGYLDTSSHLDEHGRRSRGCRRRPTTSTSTPTATTRSTSAPRPTRSAAPASRRRRSTLTDAAEHQLRRTFTRADNSAGNYVRFSIAATGFTDRGDANGARQRHAARADQRHSDRSDGDRPPPPPPDFMLHTHPHSRTVTQGAATTYDHGQRAERLQRDRSRSPLSGTPAGTTTTFNPARSRDRAIRR